MMTAQNPAVCLPWKWIASLIAADSNPDGKWEHNQKKIKIDEDFSNVL